MSNSSKPPFLPATDLAPRPGDFHVGSASSRAAARMVLKRKEREEELEANRPPDERLVCDLPRHGEEVVPGSAERARCNREDRYRQGDEIGEIVFPAHAYKGECLRVCRVPTDVSVEEALELLRDYRRNQRGAEAALHTERQF